MRRTRVAVVYTHYPHYRRPIFEELQRSEEFDFTFYYDPAGIDRSIQSGCAMEQHKAIQTFTLGPFVFQPTLLPEFLKGHWDVCVFLGNPYILSTWVYASALRLFRCKVLFWTHGWIEDEQGVKGQIRDIFYRIPHGLLLYGDRAKRIGIHRGFPDECLFPIYNSLDYNLQKNFREKREGERQSRKSFFLCVSRLIPELKLDLAIQALSLYRSMSSRDASLVVIGAGPERDRLEKLSVALEVPVDFIGAVYDEDLLSQYFCSATAVVSPGKVGLLAMHALAYGTPVITHNSWSRQMPEVEALEESNNAGIFFEYDNVSSLAEAMRKAFDSPTGVERRAACISIVEDRYTPQAQRERIEAALRIVTGRT